MYHTSNYHLTPHKLPYIQPCTPHPFSYTPFFKGPSHANWWKQRHLGNGDSPVGLYNRQHQFFFNAEDFFFFLEEAKSFFLIFLPPPDPGCYATASMPRSSICLLASFPFPPFPINGIDELVIERSGNGRIDHWTKWSLVFKKT